MSTFASHIRSINLYYDRNVREWALSLALAPLALYLCLNRGALTPLDQLAQAVHEAGHIVFGVFGSAQYAAGGVVLQVLLPAALALQFARQEFRAGVQLGLFWLGHNLANLSLFASDARAQQVPMLGREAGRTDWSTMLTQAGLLEYDVQVGSFIFLLAILGFGLSVLLPMLMWSDEA